MNRKKSIKPISKEKKVQLPPPNPDLLNEPIDIFKMLHKRWKGSKHEQTARELLVLANFLPTLSSSTWKFLRKAIIQYSFQNIQVFEVFSELKYDRDKIISESAYNLYKCFKDLSVLAYAIGTRIED
jgi:hypothetical protein